MIKKIIFSIAVMLLTMSMLNVCSPASAADAASKAGVVTLGYGSLNIRETASSSARIIGSLKNGTLVTLISKTGDWWRVEYLDGQYGYCHSSYIKNVQGTPGKAEVSWGNLNVRSGAGTNYEIKDKLAGGEGVVTLSSYGDWSRVLYHGVKTGYVNSKYLSSYNSSSANTSQYQQIKLNVPSYKQTDSRWASTKIGSSGKSISQIGCTTTAIAMIESYRAGSAIYPDAMSKKLKYTASGDVYWPSDYKVVTNGTGYLSGIYNKLKQGKPVLFGAKNKYNSQHWVVITGFKGGALTASNFIINDPGSNSRVNLQQYMNLFPTFYKYFYY